MGDEVIIEIGVMPAGIEDGVDEALVGGFVNTRPPPG
jgi:hypothetical protein